MAVFEIVYDLFIVNCVANMQEILSWWYDSTMYTAICCGYFIILLLTEIDWHSFRPLIVNYDHCSMQHVIHVIVIYVKLY